MSEEEYMDAHDAYSTRRGISESRTKREAAPPHVRVPSPDFLLRRRGEGPQKGKAAGSVITENGQRSRAHDGKAGILAIPCAVTSSQDRTSPQFFSEERGVVPTPISSSRELCSVARKC